MDIPGIQARLHSFAQERDWEQFHTPKNLATALVCEAAELAEIFQWMTPEQSMSCMADPRLAPEVRHETGRILSAPCCCVEESASVKKSDQISRPLIVASLISPANEA